MKELKERCFLSCGHNIILKKGTLEFTVTNMFELWSHQSIKINKICVWMLFYHYNTVFLCSSVQDSAQTWMPIPGSPCPHGQPLKKEFWKSSTWEEFLQNQYFWRPKMLFTCSQKARRPHKAMHYKITCLHVDITLNGIWPLSAKAWLLT